MSEAEHRPDIDTFLVEKAEELAQRLLLIQTNNPDFVIKNGHFKLLQYLEYDDRIEKVFYEYFSDTKSPHLSADEKLHLLYAREEVDFPLVSIEIKHGGKYHSEVGLVHEEAYAKNGFIYEASNRFVFSQKGKAYRIDRLVVSHRHFSDDELECIPPMETNSPTEEDLGTRINPLVPDDLEMLEKYLNLIEYFQLDSFN